MCRGPVLKQNGCIPLQTKLGKWDFGDVNQVENVEKPVRQSRSQVSRICHKILQKELIQF